MCNCARANVCVCMHVCLNVVADNGGDANPGVHL